MLIALFSAILTIKMRISNDLNTKERNACCLMFVSPLLWLNEFTHFFCYRIGQKLSVWNRLMTTVYWAIMLCFIVIVIKNENVKDLGPAWSDSHHTRSHIYLCLSYFLSYAHARTHEHFIFNQKPIMSLGSDANKTQTHTKKKSTRTMTAMIWIRK